MESVNSMILIVYRNLTPAAKNVSHDFMLIPKENVNSFHPIVDLQTFKQETAFNAKMDINQIMELV